MCDVGYLCANFSLPRPLCSRLRPDVRDRQTDRRQTELCGRPPQYAPTPCKLTFALLTLKVVSESRVTLATSVPTLVFLGLSVLDLTTDRRQTSDAHHRLMPSPYGGGHKNSYNCLHICQEVLVTIISLTKKIC